jgi:eukaryotic-like serine/threonine-protein kinase
MHEATLRISKSKLAPDHPEMLDILNSLADTYGDAGRWNNAEVLYRDTISRRRKKEKPDSILLAADLAALGRNLLKQSKWSEAEPLFREALAIRATGTPDDWARYDAMSLLSGALLGQGRFAEAEPPSVTGFEGMKSHEARIPALERFRLREAAERVVHLYEAWGKLDQATTWKAKLGLPDLPADVFAAP